MAETREELPPPGTIVQDEAYPMLSLSERSRVDQGVASGLYQTREQGAHLIWAEFSEELKNNRKGLYNAQMVRPGGTIRGI